MRISTFQPREYEMSSCIIYVHGFKGFMDWGFVPYLADFFSNQGFFVITFNFSHNGVGASLTEFDELEKFEKNTISLEVEELNEIISACANDYFYKRDNKPIGILGHSRGGGVSILASSRNKSVNAVATWASISKFDRYTKKEKNFGKKLVFLKL